MFIRDPSFWATHVNQNCACFLFLDVLTLPNLYGFVPEFVQNHDRRVQKLHFRLTCVVQKRCCLRSLLVRFYRAHEGASSKFLLPRYKQGFGGHLASPFLFFPACLIDMWQLWVDVCLIKARACLQEVLKRKNVILQLIATADICHLLVTSVLILSVLALMS